MNVQNLLTSLSEATALQKSNSGDQTFSSQQKTGSALSSGLAGGAVAGGIMALLVGSKSARKMGKKVAKYGGAAVLGGLAYRAYGNWSKNKALGKTAPITETDITEARVIASKNPVIPNSEGNKGISLEFVLINTMIAASKADGNIDTFEQKQLFKAIDQLGISDEEKSFVFDAMSRDITVQEIADSVTLDEHKADVYLAAYMAIEVDHQLERTFLNNLAIALDLPKGFAAYLEQQADQGIAD